jgi:ketosteroid isomerase-like protein
MYEIWDAEDLPRVLELLDPEFEWVNLTYPVHPGIRRGHDGMEKVMENLRESFEHQVRVLGVEEQHLWTLRDGKILRIQWFHDADEARRAAGLGSPDE